MEHLPLDRHELKHEGRVSDPQIKASVRRYMLAAAERRSSGARTNHDKWVCWHTNIIFYMQKSVCTIFVTRSRSQRRKGCIAWIKFMVKTWTWSVLAIPTCIAYV